MISQHFNSYANTHPHTPPNTVGPTAPYPFNPVSSAPPRIKEHYITIDSRDRDAVQWPLSANFEVQLNPSHVYSGAMLRKPYRNIKSIEFVNAIFPTTCILTRNSVTREVDTSKLMYMYLCIPEIEGAYDATNSSGLKAFTKLFIHHPIGDKFYYATSGELNAQRKVYDVNLQRLDKLTIELRHYDGSLIKFKEYDPVIYNTEFPDVVQSYNDLSITLRITTCDQQL
jgi:hypothetical protein